MGGVPLKEVTVARTLGAPGIQINVLAMAKNSHVEAGAHNTGGIEGTHPHAISLGPSMRDGVWATIGAPQWGRCGNLGDSIQDPNHWL